MKLKYVNSLLLGLIILVDGYIVAAPVLPQISFWWRSNHSARQQQLTQAIQAAAAPSNPLLKQDNSLVIPKLLLNQPALEAPKSQWDAVLRKGIWHWPDSSTPDKGGNSVFLAHRFSYTGPHGAFYYLDKLTVGDRITVIWDHKQYDYKVTSSRQVPPTETSVENATSDSRLTLFTCTPLWHPVNRLVVVAELETKHD